MPAGNPPLGAEPGGVQSVDHLQAPAPAPSPARCLDPGLVPQGGDHRRFRLRAHGAVEIEGVVAAGEQADGDVEMTGAEGEVVAEGALDVQLLQDHFAPFPRPPARTHRTPRTPAPGAPGSPVLELHFRFQLQAGQQLRLEFQGEPGDVDQGAVVGSRALGKAFLVRAVIEPPVVDLPVAAQPQRRLPGGRKQRRREQEAGGGGDPVLTPLVFRPLDVPTSDLGSMLVFPCRVLRVSRPSTVRRTPLLQAWPGPRARGFRSVDPTAFS